MNGAADLGGMAGFGPVVPEQDEPLFHHPWEERVMGMVVALGATGSWNLDQSRFGRESLDPSAYLSMSYYEIWYQAAVNMMLERGMITRAELDTGRSQCKPKDVLRTLKAKDVAAVLNRGGPADRPVTRPQKLQPGQRIRTINEHPDSHTRLPRYARDKIGTVVKVHGFHVFPDRSALGLGDDPQWLYKVAFDAQSLWGKRGAEGDVVNLDLWEPYLMATP